MERNSCAVRSHDFFGLDIESLPDFVWAAVAEFAFAGYACRYFHLLAVGEGLKSGIGEIRWASQLDVKGACKKERQDGQGCGEPVSFLQEVESCGEQCDCGCNPQCMWTPSRCAGNDSARVGQRGPEHGLAGGLELEFERRRRNWLRSTSGAKALGHPKFLSQRSKRCAPQIRVSDIRL